MCGCLDHLSHLFKVSIKTIIALSMGMDGYKLMTLYDTGISP